jgi:zinc/manganese transport system substrate-binding protein
MRALLVASLVVLTAVGLVGCAPAANAGSGSVSGDRVTVLATTNVWGSVAKAIGGSYVSVTSVIDDQGKDPHEYSASARNQLELSRARLLIENGGGYDDFIRPMVSASNNARLLTVNAVASSGHGSDSDLNEHVWYDFVGVKSVAASIEAALAKIDPAHRSNYASAANSFEGKVDALIATEATLNASYAGEGVAITEPVPVYILDAIGLVDKTPAAFSKAIEDGTDASPAVLQAAIAVFDTRSVQLLAYNEQTTGAETAAALAAAKSNGIPVVGVTETLPDGEDYLSWMRANLDSIRAALAS